MVRKFYSNNNYKHSGLTMEQYLLSASGENKQLDAPLTEKSLIGALSRQFSEEIAKHVVMKGVNTVEEFAEILCSWEELERERGGVEKEIPRQEVNRFSDYNNQNNWRKAQERRWNEREWGRDDYRAYKGNEAYGKYERGYQANARKGNYREENERYGMTRNNAREDEKGDDRGRLDGENKDMDIKGGGANRNTRGGRLN